jgi:uncharacterized protein (DUF433 family)
LAGHAACVRFFADQRPPGYIVNMESKRITTNPRQMGGVPCLRGLRIPVATVIALVAEGQTTEGILALYPDLEADDVREALLFAAEATTMGLRALPSSVESSCPRMVISARCSRYVRRDSRRSSSSAASEAASRRHWHERCSQTCPSSSTPGERQHRNVRAGSESSALASDWRAQERRVPEGDGVSTVSSGLVRTTAAF